MRADGTGRTSILREATHTTQAGEKPAEVSNPAGPPMVARVVPLRRDTTYDHKADEARMPVEIQFRDGTTARSDLVLNPSQLYAGSIQLERAVTARETAVTSGPT